jgi:NADH dehydrogenase FAD-containing subunit
MKRRTLLKSSLLAFLALTSSTFAQEEKQAKKREKRSKNPHVVVVGGGWAGLSFARSIRKFAPKTEVTLIEKREFFFSCPVSNSWMFNLVDMDFITHSFIDAANNHGYTYLQAEAIGLDSKNNILQTTEGDIDYDYLVFATGIEYDYTAWSKGDKDFENRLKREYPAAFISGSEHITLKHKIENFNGGNFVLTVPRGNYRCLSGPYERACLLADYIKHNKIDGKVILLDANNTVTIKEEGFLSLFKELYKDELVYHSSFNIEKIDLDKKIIVDDFDEELEFEDASFYPSVRAPKLLEKLGLTIKTVYNRVEANLDVYTNRFKGHDNIFGCGDLRPMGFSKSGNTAFTEGENVAKVVADIIHGKKPEWRTPITLCLSVVSTKPAREMSVLSEYKYGPKGETDFASSSTDEDWKHSKLGEAEAQHHWAKSMYDAMFYS